MRQAALLAFWVALPLGAQDKKAPPPPKIDEAKIEQAIKKGVQYLLEQ